MYAEPMNHKNPLVMCEKNNSLPDYLLVVP